MRPVASLDAAATGKALCASVKRATVNVAGDIRTFAAIGAHELIFDFRGESISESIERLQKFATEVVPLVTG